MFVGVAAGGPAVAIFHLVTHALGKAGLFLAAGVFQRDRGSVQLEDLRGAGRDNRRAFAGFAICAMSIAAVPPLAAFWSKDHIVAAAQPKTLWFVLVLISAAGSSAYLLRPALILWDPAGAGRAPARAGRGPMLAGVTVLAACSLFAGVLGDPLTRLLHAPALPSSSLGLVLSLLALAAGAVAVRVGISVPTALVAAARDQLYAGRLQAWLVVRPVLGTSRLLRSVEDRGLDCAVDAVGRAGLAGARGADWVERRGIDAAVDGLARAVGRSGTESRRLQSGRLYEYLRDAALGAVAVAALVALSALT
jgi:NADH-quinone oxidoreductase subunit L